MERAHQSTKGQTVSRDQHTSQQTRARHRESPEDPKADSQFHVIIYNFRNLDRTLRKKKGGRDNPELTEF